MFICIISLILVYVTGGLTITEQPFRYNRTALEQDFLINASSAGWNVQYEPDIWKRHCGRYYETIRPMMEADEIQIRLFEPFCKYKVTHNVNADPVMFQYIQSPVSPKVDILRCTCWWKNIVVGTIVRSSYKKFYLSEIELSLSNDLTQEEYEYNFNHWKYFELERKIVLANSTKFYRIKRCWIIAMEL